MKQRLFVEKKQGFDQEAVNLKNTLRDISKQDIKNLRLIEVYDLFNIDEVLYTTVKERIFTDALIDDTFETIDLDGYSVVSYETVDGQYDQSADATQRHIKLIDAKSDVTVKTGTLILMDQGLDLTLIKKYLMNPVEVMTKDLSVMELRPLPSMKAMKDYSGFIKMDQDALEAFYQEESWAMEFEDMQYIQDYFIKEERDPSETELKVLDTYWSDHCRHTTFFTHLDNIEFEDFALRPAVEQSFKTYLEDKELLGREDKAISLMDITTQVGRYAKRILKDEVIEVSEEVNACSIVIDVDVDGVNEPWLLMFKNETHNHPTEIEPFGGASTCIGGAIRDPLSGRAYVYQAMRITGSGNVLTPFEETMEHKLAESVISRKAAEGYSHYAKQIGIASSYVQEIYHDSYRAKRMELGAVVGAVKQADIVRMTPLKGDVIVMLGGRTGRDGVGGATGSSDTQTVENIDTFFAEVQKGNALEERKIVRLFRNPEVTKMIKKSNDFGAGGVSVAIGELADGLEIDLDCVKTKYEGLNPCEIAISESQERMAVVLDPKDLDRFIELAQGEDCEAVVVAKVTDTNRLIIKDKNGIHVDLDRDFLNSSGVTQHANARIQGKNMENPLQETEILNKEAILDTLGSLRHASQKGLAQMFDSSVGGTTVLKPLSGQFELTPNVASVQMIPLLKGQTQTCSILSHGFIPEVSEYSPYIGGMMAVVESVSKTVAVGGDYTKIYLSFQEYFNRLTNDVKWGNVLQALLGTYTSLKELGLSAIGGKDSMSGSFGDIDVVDTLVSFACSPANSLNIVSSEFKQLGSKLYILEAKHDGLGNIDFDQLKEDYAAYHELILEGKVLSAATTDSSHAILALLKMSFGNGYTFNLQAPEALIASLKPGSIVFESADSIQGFEMIGTVTGSEQYVINDTVIELEDALQRFLEPLQNLYPSENLDEVEHRLPFFDTEALASPFKQDEVEVLVPVFPGTTGEYELMKAFSDQGAVVKSFVYSDIEDDEALAKAISTAHIVALAGGSLLGDEPHSVGHGYKTIFNANHTKQALSHHLDQKRLVLGFGNGYQALVKTGLLPYGKLCDSKLSFAKNKSSRHVSSAVSVQVQSNHSVAYKGLQPGLASSLFSSNTYGRLVGDVDYLVHHGLVASTYVDINPSGSVCDIEGLSSECGLVFGQMSHPEQSLNQKDHQVFKNAVSYFRGNL